MKYLFILGRNIDLSIAEIKAVLGNVEFVLRKNALLVELPKVGDNLIEKFGGVIAIGEVIEDVDKHVLYSGNKNKFNYVVWNFSDSAEEFSSYLKKRFKHMYRKNS